MFKLHPKVAGGSMSGAFAILIVYVLTLVNVDLPATAAAAVGTVLSGLGAYLVPSPPS